MVTRKNKGYTKTKTDFFKLFMDNKNKSIFKDPSEPLEKWIIRKAEEQGK